MQRASYCVAARITTVLLASIAKEQDNSRDPEKVFCWTRIPVCISRVLTIVHADSDGIKRLELDQVWLGRCDLIEHVMIGEDKLLRFSEVPLEEACTVVIRGATQYDALCTLAATVEETLGKEFMAIQSFGRAMLSYESRQRVISSVDSFSCYWSETSQSLDQLHRFAQHPTGPVNLELHNTFKADGLGKVFIELKAEAELGKPEIKPEPDPKRLPFYYLTHSIKIPLHFFSLLNSFRVRRSNCQRTFANYETRTVKAIKKNLKKCKWDAARYALHLLADLFNCHRRGELETTEQLVLEDSIGNQKRSWRQLTDKTKSKRTHDWH
ncbi:conserved hypothetical protein [Culex quinquefasciatus]|uniref:Uncharacterized protein n=1 Tax=Culex quinquefasciatus TaxID=7176 RepID=B0X0X0_CULQU|nr:conserved hypothetical protein [Culex quinquefasciatus]|eukprot:XP_001863292.1 conserved hypothetical protein [Culex quinquefasciatus]